MQNMTAFIASALTSFADFLASEPIIYLFGLVLMLYVFKAVSILIKP